MALKIRRRRKNPEAAMTVVEHLTELRSRLIWAGGGVVIGTAIAWPVFGRVYRLLTDSFCSFMRVHTQFAINPKNPCQLVFTSPLEPFLVKIKVVVFLGLVLALPVVLYQFWRFVTPALTSNERRYAVPFIVSSLLLFALGGWFAMLTLPKALNFLLGFAGDQRIVFVMSIAKYIGFVGLLVLAFGASFEFPVVLISLVSVGVLNSQKLRKARRGAILGIAVFAAVITPSQDWFTMSAMMLPMLVFYELSILVARLMKK
jgi:sec-independent protein translocase protein TatC